MEHGTHTLTVVECSMFLFLLKGETLLYYLRSLLARLSLPILPGMLACELDPYYPYPHYISLVSP